MQAEFEGTFGHFLVYRLYFCMFGAVLAIFIKAADISHPSIFFPLSSKHQFLPFEGHKASNSDYYKSSQVLNCLLPLISEVVKCFGNACC